MSKELTPLEALWKIDHTICMNNCESGIKWNIDKPEDYPEGGYDEKDTDCKSFEDFAECYEMVETALKRLEEKEHNCDVYFKQMTGLASKLAQKSKVLEIINNKKVNTDYFWNVLKEFKVHKGKVKVWDRTYTNPLEYYNEHLFYRTMDDPEVSKYLKKKYYLTQEEFDLLKEELK